MKHGEILKSLLDRFCEYSGHRINARKTNIFFLKGVEEPMTNMISNSLGFQKVQNLENYLGVLLFHQRVTKSTLYFIVEKVQRKL